MDALAVAEKFFRAIERGDIEAIRSCYAPDARVWHNFDGIEQTVDQNLATLIFVAKRLPERRYDVSRREAISDGFLQQHVMRGTLQNGNAFAIDACIVCKVADGRITRLDEYIDLGQAAALSAA